MKVKILKYDIALIEVDVIVNAANSTLLGGEGVDGAIHRASGPELLEACKNIRENQFPNGLPKGKVVVTEGFNLKSKFIIHTVGPVFGKDDIMILKNCYINSLNLADELNCKSIAFPSISTGAYGVPIKDSANVVKRVLEDYNPRTIETVMLIVFSDEDLKVYKEILGSLVH